MVKKTVAKVLISLDQESVDILGFFEHKAMNKSGTVQLALASFYKEYVRQSLDGERVIHTGEVPPMAKLLATPRTDQKAKLASAPVGEGPADDITIEPGE